MDSMKESVVLRYSLVALATAIGVHWLPSFPNSTPPTTTAGSTHPAWHRVQQAFRANFEGGWEKEGSAFAVYHKGELVVDLWGGWADKEAGRPWTKDTRTVAYSCTKAVSAMAALMLVDRGHLDLDAPVVRYWPEFGKHGKDVLSVRDLLSHRAGLVAIDEDRPITMDMLMRDGWQNLSRVFEDQVPNWELGNDWHGYHVLTYGWLVDNLVRRADPRGRSVGVFVREEIALPHGVDFSIGTEPLEFHRVARATPPSLRETFFSFSSFGALFLKIFTLHSLVTGERNLMDDVFKNPNFIATGLLTSDQRVNDPAMLHIEGPAFNGVGSARSIAHIFHLYNQGSLVARNGTVWERLRVPVTEFTTDMVIRVPVPIDWNCGFWVAQTPQGDVELGHPGYGGQNVKFVPELELSFAYVTNGLTPDMGDDAHNFAALRTAVYQTLQELGENPQLEENAQGIGRN